MTLIVIVEHNSPIDSSKRMWCCITKEWSNKETDSTSKEIEIMRMRTFNDFFFTQFFICTYNITECFFCCLVSPFICAALIIIISIDLAFNSPLCLFGFVINGVVLRLGGGGPGTLKLCSGCP